MCVRETLRVTDDGGSLSSLFFLFSSSPQAARLAAASSPPPLRLHFPHLPGPGTRRDALVRGRDDAAGAHGAPRARQLPRPRAYARRHYQRPPPLGLYHRLKCPSVLSDNGGIGAALGEDHRWRAAHRRHGLVQPQELQPTSECRLTPSCHAVAHALQSHTQPNRDLSLIHILTLPTKRIV